MDQGQDPVALLLEKMLLHSQSRPLQVEGLFPVLMGLMMLLAAFVQVKFSLFDLVH